MILISITISTSEWIQSWWLTNHQTTDNTERIENNLTLRALRPLHLQAWNVGNGQWFLAKATIDRHKYYCLVTLCLRERYLIFWESGLKAHPLQMNETSSLISVVGHDLSCHVIKYYHLADDTFYDAISRNHGTLKLALLLYLHLWNYIGHHLRYRLDLYTSRFISSSWLGASVRDIY